MTEEEKAQYIRTYGMFLTKRKAPCIECGTLTDVADPKNEIRLCSETCAQRFYATWKHVSDR